MDLKLILGVVIVVVLLYIIWSYFFTSMEVLMSFQKGTELTTKSLDKIVDGSRNNYSFSVWVYVDEWGVNYDNNKNILAIAPGITSPCFFALFLSPRTNDLNIYVEPSTAPSVPTTGNIFNSLKTTCGVTNFPLQTWVNISVSVYNRAIDVYIDGKLIRTCSMTKVASAISNRNNIFIGGSRITGGSGTPGNNEVPGFSGFIASVVYSPEVFSPKEVWDIYARGYTNSAFDLNALKRYKLELAFLKDNSVLKSFSI